MNKFKTVYLLLLSFFIFQQTVIAKPTEITVATDSWPPFRILENNNYTGIDFDLWKEVEKRLNLKIKFIRYPWARILHNLEHGEIDAMSGLAKRKNREVYMHYTSPSYYTCATVFYVKKGNKHLIKKYEDLYKYSIAYVNNSAYFKRFDEDTKLRKYPIASEFQLIRMLERSRVEVIIGTDCQADYEIKKLGLKDKFEKAEFKPNNNVDLYIAISKKSPFAKELKRLNEVIKQIVEERIIIEYSKKYFE